LSEGIKYEKRRNVGFFGKNRQKTTPPFSGAILKYTKKEPFRHIQHLTHFLKK